MEDCLFCMIAEGKIPQKLYEDEQVVAFYDINPRPRCTFGGA